MTVEKAYDLLADTHDSQRAGNHAKEENLLIFKYLIAQGYTADQVIEVGSGTGLLIDYLDEHVPPNKYLGVDISREMVSVAKAKHPNYSFSVNDMRRIPVLDHLVEALVCVFCGFSYLTTTMEIEDALREFLRVMRPKGKLFLMVWGEEAFEQRIDELKLEGKVLPRRIYANRLLAEMVGKAFENVKLWGMSSRWFNYLPGWTPRLFLRLWLWIERRTFGKWRPSRGRYIICEATKPKEVVVLKRKRILNGKATEGDGVLPED